jgi:Transposase DDE domain
MPDEHTLLTTSPTALLPNAEQVVGDIETFLHEAISLIEPAVTTRERTGPGSTRRILPAMLLWAGLLVCVLRGFSSQLALWRLLTRQGLWGHPPLPLSDQAVYKRLGTSGTAVLEQVFTHISAILCQRLAPSVQTTLAPFASDVLALDETTLDQVARLLPALRDAKPGDRRLLPGKLTGLFDLRRQQWLRIEHQPNPNQNEKVAARRMLAGLAHGCLLLADLGYFGFAWFDDLTDQGLWWVSRLRAGTSYTVAHVAYHQGQTLDALVWLGAYRADRTKHLVRLVQFQAHSATYRYLTNVLDPTVLPMADIARIYARRWDIELAFKTAKVQLKLGLLWSAREVVVLQQVWAVLILSQVLQALRLEIAARADADLFEVSLPLLIEYLPFFGSFGDDPMQAFVEDGRRLRFIRPSSRLQIQAPVIPASAYAQPPPDLRYERTPRYAGRQGHGPNHEVHSCLPS